MGFWLHVAFSLMKVPKEMIQRNNGTEEKFFIFFFRELRLLIRPPFAVSQIFPPSPYPQYHSRH